MRRKERKGEGERGKEKGEDIVPEKRKELGREMGGAWEGEEGRRVSYLDFINLPQARIMHKEGTSDEKKLASDWPLREIYWTERLGGRKQGGIKCPENLEKTSLNICISSAWNEEESHSQDAKGL